MPLTANFARTKSPILFVLAATIAFAALSASPFLNHASAAGPESVEVFAGDCATPQTIFYLGDTVCVRATGFPLHPSLADYYRRFNWSAPGHRVAQTGAVKSDPDYEKFSIPTSGDFAVAGKWRVQTVDIETNTRAYANFTVRNPRLFLVDLSAWKWAHDFVHPGDRLRYTITFKNDGPELAEFVQFAEDVPTNATFYALKQRSGSLFECSTPQVGATGRILCSTKYMKNGEEASFDVYYTVNPEAREGDFCEGRTQIASNTEEMNKGDNVLKYSTRIANPLKEEPKPVEEADNPFGYEGERVEMPASEPVNSPDYKGDAVIWPKEEKENPPDYEGEDVIWPEPEVENP
jgi:uncharacterized repeat protein (TIGR01451 family)